MPYQQMNSGGGMDMSAPQEAPDQGQPQGQGNDSPLSGPISTVEQYIKNPRLITPQTMQDLLAQLKDADAYYNDEESSEGDTGDQGGSKLSSMIRGGGGQ